jgi:hypothetical protein
MAVLFADVNACLEHERRKGNSRDPCIETERQEYSEYQEDDAGGVVSLVEVEDCGSESPDDVQDT